MRRQGGSIRKRGSVYYVIYRTPVGKQKWESGFPNKASARAYLNEILIEINKGTYIEPKPVCSPNSQRITFQVGLAFEARPRLATLPLFESTWCRISAR